MLLQMHMRVEGLHRLGRAYDLQRADAVRGVGDLALQVAAQHAFGLDGRPDEKAMVELGEPWRPWRAVAARVLWSYYRVIKQKAK